MQQLRDPERGCPWDREQSFQTIAPYTIEEAYEVVEAIEQGDLAQLRDELGDLLFQVVFYTQMAEEIGAFDFDEVTTAVADKMIRRHPHVFGSDDVADAEAQSRSWEEIKAGERQQSAGKEALSALDGVGVGLPGLTRAVKLQRRAARVGFDWGSIDPVFDKLDEEIGELRHEVRQGEDADRMEEELGDLLFVAANLARHLRIDPETALRGANAKFERRFRYIEQALAAQGRTPEDALLEEMDALWNAAKAAEREL
jgi:MazG family protein